MRTIPRRELLPVCLLLLVGACGGGGESGDARVEEEPLNVLLVTIDTLRRDHVGCYGYFRDTTPRLDALAEESLVFDDLQVHIAQTLPSHTSFFTGLSPREHGIESNLGRLNERYLLSPKIRTLATVLDEQGYRTAGFISASPLAKGTGIEAGFRTWVEPETTTTADVTVDAALEWLGAEPGTPWFVWVHLFDPHYPYTAPPEFRRFEGGQAQRDHFDARGIPTKHTTRKGREFQVLREHDSYDAEILFADHHVGRILDRLRDSGLWDRTAVVVTSDHGEGLWQHGIKDHSHIWNEQLEVPLIVRVPGVAARRVERRMVGRDLLPTMLALLPGIDRRELTAQSSGRDVLAAEFQAPPRYTIVPPMPDGVDWSGRLPRYRHALEHDGWRLVIREDAAVELYHLVNDPYELHDLAAFESGRVAEMKRLLERENERELTRRAALEAGQSVPMGEDLLEAMRALGYAGETDE